MSGFTDKQRRLYEKLHDLMYEEDAWPEDVLAVLPEVWQDVCQARKDHGDWQIKEAAKR